MLYWLYDYLMLTCMPQTRFVFPSVNQQRIDLLDQKLLEVYRAVKRGFHSVATFQEVLINSRSYQSRDLVDRQEPEEFVKRKLIEPIIEFLGYEIVPETVLSAPAGSTRTPDYTIRPRNQAKPLFYVEAEPLHVELRSPNYGVNQVDEWISLRSSRTDYGIATNGLDWILLKYDTVSNSSNEILQVNLRPLFIRFLHRSSLDTEETLLEIKKKLLVFDVTCISSFLNNYLETIDRTREEISKKFYNDYVKYVFGFDSEGNPTQGASLLNRIVRPAGVSEDDAKLFAVIFMNRMIFIKFLEQKEIVPRNLLEELFREHGTSRLMLTFYKMYLQPLFYEVFNKSRNNRAQSIQAIPLYDNIPYLNGGLFRETIESENSYDIENDGIELVLENLLERYDFGQGQEIDPNILGYIFEKTINFISGTGETNQQKMKGAYYTPDDLVEFIIEETVVPVIFRKMMDSLRESGWRDADLRGYNSLADILGNMPQNPVHVKRMIDSIDSVRVLDPACGSGHFLTGTLSKILHIKESLLRIIGASIDRCKLKRDIVSKNLFGVDIDENAIEIAKLRLWLSIIQDVESSTHIETLPNIDFNIFPGNSLIGWLNESLVTHPLNNLMEDTVFREKLNDLRNFHRAAIQEVETLLSTSTLENIVTAYRKLVAIYTLESGERAVEIRNVLAEIRDRLYEVIDQSYIDFLHEYGRFDAQELGIIGRNFTSLTPFHWKIDFQNVLLDGGFDVVVGNPPYGNILKEIEKTIIFHFQTKDAAEIAANFVERIYPVIKENGFIGLVLANSIAINASTSTARAMIRRNMTTSKMALFGTRPAKLFKGVEIRAMVFLGEKDQPENEGTILTTEAIKFNSKQRSSLLENLSFENTEGLTLGRNRIGDNLEDNSLPKVGNPTIRNILLKLKDSSTAVFGEKINREGFTYSFDFRKTGGYWLNALETFPYRSTKVEKVYLENQVERDFSILLINSSLFYLYWSTYSNLRDFPLSLLERFPFPSLETLNSHSSEISDLKNRISTCLSGTFVSHTAQGGSGRVGEFRTARCRHEIDEIDEMIAPMYGLNATEVAFVKSYDLHIRK
jgi:type I restriction-modification system DNA methylase subunit